MPDTDTAGMTNNAAPASTLIVYLTDDPSTLDYKATLANLAASAAFTDNYVLKSLLDAVGDLYVASADNTPARLAKGAQGQHLVTDTAETLDLKWVSAVDRQTFTGDGTWTKPLNVSATSMTLIRCIGGGGGGGGGRVAAAGVIHYGGGGGGGGGVTELWVPTSLLGATETVTIGIGGTAGAGGVQPTNNGTNGVIGGNTTFGTWCLGGQGNFGLGGKTTVSQRADAGLTSQGCVARSPGIFNGPGMMGNPGGVGGGGAAGDLPGGWYQVISPLGNINPGGGGGGGGITSGGAVENGMAGGYGSYSQATAGTAGSGATPGGAGGASAALCGGGGGGGSGSRVDATGVAGGAGGDYGGGGGGGGATSGAFNAGAGGAGKAGYCEAVTWL